MGQIKIESAAVLEIGAKVNAQSAAMGQVSSIIAGVARNLDMQIAASASIDETLERLRRSSLEQEDQLQTMTVLLNRATDEFMETDRRIGSESRDLKYLLSVGGAAAAGLVQTIVGLKGLDLLEKIKVLNGLFGLDRPDTIADATAGLAQIETEPVSTKKGFFDRLSDGWNKVTDTVKDGWNTIKTGVANTVDAAKDTVAGWVTSYKEKGTVYKVVQTGAAVVGIIGSGAAIVGAWTASAMTAGAGVPGAILVSGYATNDIANQITDIKNCWWGDVNKVNEVNHLEEALEDGAGDIAVALGGDRETGERLGSALYTGGELLTVVTEVDDLMGKVIQSPDFLATAQKGMGEVKTGVKGLVDIAVHSDVRDIGKDLALLKHQVPNLVETVGTAGTIKDLGETAIDIGGKAIDIGKDIYGSAQAAWK